jgi:hypothetical protein
LERAEEVVAVPCSAVQQRQALAALPEPLEPRRLIA